MRYINLRFTHVLYIVRRTNTLYYLVSLCFILTSLLTVCCVRSHLTCIVLSHLCLIFCLSRQKISAVRQVFFSFRIESSQIVIVGVKSHLRRYLLNKFNCFYDTALHIRVRLESLGDPADADDSMFVDFVGCYRRGC